MNEGGKIQALSLSTVRERLLSKRQDGIVSQNSASNASKTPGPVPVPSGASPQEKTCAYAKCGVKFTPRRPDQVYHSPDCRKRAWFDRNFAPIAKIHI
jgi:hypothetical protein